MLERSSVLLRAVGCLLALVTAGCGGGAALRAAEKGDLEAVRRALPAEDKAALDVSEARTIAHAVLEQEIRDARGETGVQKLRELSSCAEAMDDDLDARSDKLDDVAAVAGLLRFQARLIDHDELTEHAREALSRQGTPMIWRAVLARGLVTPEHAAERRALFTDNDELVRLAAIQAAFDAFDLSDLEPLLEAARLDPHPPTRLAAIEAAGSLGGERAVYALRDQFVQANEDEQIAIVGAWSSPRSIDAGGRAELVRTAETSKGQVALAAAAVLMRRGGNGNEQGAGVLTRAINAGTTRERVFAIQAATLSDAGLRRAVLDAQTDPDEDVALAALGRALELYAPQGDAAPPKERAEVITKLLVIARSDGLRALMAKSTLARGAAREVLPLLQVDARSDDAQARKNAGISLLALGEPGRATRLVVDKDDRVRRSVACAMLRKN